MESNLIDVEVADGVYKTIHWPFCAKKGCTNRTWHNSKYCYPHTNYTGLELMASMLTKLQPFGRMNLNKIGGSHGIDLIE